MLMMMMMMLMMMVVTMTMILMLVLMMLMLMLMMMMTMMMTMMMMMMMMTMMMMTMMTMMTMMLMTMMMMMMTMMMMTMMMMMMMKVTMRRRRRLMMKTHQCNPSSSSKPLGGEILYKYQAKISCLNISQNEDSEQKIRTYICINVINFASCFQDKLLRLIVMTARYWHQFCGRLDGATML